MSINKTVYWQMLSLIFVLLLSTGCNTLQLQLLEKKVRDMQSELYTPQSAILLDQVSQVGHKEFVAPNCIIAYLESTYGINRPLAEVIDEYHTKLSTDKWELNPLYEPNKTHEDIFLHRGTQLELTIYSITDPDRAPLTNLKSKATEFITVYVVALTYAEPSSLECSI